MDKVATKGSIIANMIDGSDCLAGTLYEQQTHHYIEFAFKYFTVLGDFGQTIIMTWSAIWLAWVFFTASFATDKFNKDEIVLQFIKIILVNLFYAGWPFIWDIIFFLLNVGFWSMGQALSVASGQEISPNIPTVVCAVTDSVWAGFADTINNLPWGDKLSLAMPFYGLILFVSFFLMWLRFFGAYISPLARIFGVLSTLGLTSMMVLFQPFRTVPMNNVKIMITGILELALVGAIIGLSLDMIDSVMQSVPIREGNFYVPLVGTFWGSKEYWLIVLTNVFIWMTFKEMIGVIQTQMDVVLSRGGGLIRSFI